MNKIVKQVLLSLAAVLIIVFIIFVMSCVNKKKQSEENKLYNNLNMVTKEFYKDYYYPVVLYNNPEAAAAYKDKGIKLTLNELANYKGNDRDSILSLFKNYKNGSNCDYNNTKVTIYPVDPYGKEDIRIDGTVVCGIN